MLSFLKGIFGGKNLDVVSSVSKEDYERQREVRKSVYDGREAYLLEVAKTTSDTFDGFCFVCNKPTTFKVARDPKSGTPWWRESFDCPGCGFNTRLRALLHMYFGELERNRGKQIYITEQITPLYRWLHERLDNVVGSEYLGSDLGPGEARADGVRNEDFTKLSFPTDSLDYILSFEVLEHVPDYKAALSEALRCLKPGGKLILSAPFIRMLPKTLVRASISPSGEIVHHETPDYHGNPLDPQGSLCFYYFSFDLLDDMRAAGFKDVVVNEYWSKEYVYLGLVNQTYITAKKP